MGTRGGGDGDGPGLPGLPPEWGQIVIPDDPAELAEEAAEVRRELRETARRRRWHGRLSRLTGRGDVLSLRLPLLIMFVAIVAALTSLFVVTWPAPRQPPRASRPPSETSPRPVASTRPETVPAVDLLDERGRAVSLRSLLPAVIMLTDKCPCGDVIAGTAAAAPPGVTVIAVAARAPAAANEPRVRALADPTGGLRTTLVLDPPSGNAAVLLVGRDARIIRTVEATSSVAAYRADLPGLAPAQVTAR